MNLETARFLNECNERFYLAVHESFSATRSSAWGGWADALPYLSSLSNKSDRPIQALDLACGNMRFAKFVQTSMPEMNTELHCVDNCLPLVDSQAGARFTQLDLVSLLLEGDRSSFEKAIPPASYDLAVCFGFFHHVPAYANRESLMNWLIDSLKPGGVAVISFWRFMANGRLAEKARQSHAACLSSLAKGHLTQDELEEGDYLLSWQDRRDVCRYCHHFDGEEVSQLLSSVSDRVALLDRYYADGKDGRTNEYLVLRREENSEISS